MMIKNLIPLSEGAAKMFREMSRPELESFMDHSTEIVMKMQPFSEDIEIVVDRVVSEEAEKLYQDSDGYRKMMQAREKINADMRSRPTGISPISKAESGDPSEQLERLTRRLMTENPELSYSQALNVAQGRRKDLAEAILKQLEEYRRSR